MFLCTFICLLSLDFINVFLFCFSDKGETIPSKSLQGSEVRKRGIQKETMLAIE